MITASPSFHRSAMANLHIAHITAPAEHRMKAQTADEQLRFALAESHASQLAFGRPNPPSRNSIDLCKYLVGI